MSTEQQLHKLRSRAESLLDAFMGMRLNYALLTPLLGDPDEPVPHVQVTGLQSGLPALRSTLFTVCVLDAVKLAWDRHKHTPSLANIIESLNGRELIESLKELTDPIVVIPAGDDEEEYLAALTVIEADERSRRRNNVEVAYRRLLECWREFESLPCKDEFLRLRDKSIAHLELRVIDGTYEPLDIGALDVRRRDLGLVVQSMERMICDVTAIARDAHFAMDEAAHMFDRQGKRFWSRLGLPV